MLGGIIKQDTTEYKRAEIARRESGERVRLLLDSTAKTIYGIDLKGTCTFVNRACLRLLCNENAEELLGENMHRVVHHTRADGKPYPVTECHIFRASQRGEETHFDDEVLWRAGAPGPQWLGSSSNRQRNRGGFSTGPADIGFFDQLRAGWLVWRSMEDGFNLVFVYSETGDLPFPT